MMLSLTKIDIYLYLLVVTCLALPSNELAARPYHNLLKSPFQSPRKEIIEIIRSDSSETLQQKLNIEKWKNSALIETHLKNGETLLTYAIQVGSFSCAKILIETDIINGLPNLQNRPPLFYAILSNQKDLVQLLLDKGSFFDSQISELSEEVSQMIQQKDDLIIQSIIIASLRRGSYFSDAEFERMISYVVSKKKMYVLEKIVTCDDFEIRNLSQTLLRDLYEISVESDSWKIIETLLKKGALEGDSFKYVFEHQKALAKLISKNKTQLFLKIWSSISPETLSHTTKNEIIQQAAIENSDDILKILFSMKLTQPKYELYLRYALKSAVHNNSHDATKYLLELISLTPKSMNIMSDSIIEYCDLSQKQHDIKIFKLLLSYFESYHHIEEDFFIKIYYHLFLSDSDELLKHLSSLPFHEFSEKHKKILIKICFDYSKEWLLAHLIRSQIINPNDNIPEYILGAYTPSNHLLAFAFDNNHLELIEEIMNSKSFDPNSLFRNQSDHILFSIIKNYRSDQTKFIERLLCMIDPEKLSLANSDGETLLSSAIRYRQFNMIALLLTHTDLLHEENNQGLAPISIAIESQDIEIIKILITAGAKINSLYQWSEPLILLTPLMYSALTGNLELVELLLKSGALVSYKNLEGKTAYDYALNEEIRYKIAYEEYKQTYEYDLLKGNLKNGVTKDLIDIIFLDKIYHLPIGDQFIKDHLSILFENINHYEIYLYLTSHLKHKQSIDHREILKTYQHFGECLLLIQFEKYLGFYEGQIQPTKHMICENYNFRKERVKAELSQFESWTPCSHPNCINGQFKSEDSYFICDLCNDESN